MIDGIKIGDMVKDVCGDVGEVIDIEYGDNREVWRYILAEYDDDVRHTWPAHPDYASKVK